MLSVPWIMTTPSQSSLAAATRFAMATQSSGVMFAESRDA